MELGIYTFVEAIQDSDGSTISGYQRLKDLMEEIELADQLGLDVFGIGEHHRHEFVASSPATLLAAAAVKTKNIRLTSSVTVLSSDDPVRVFQEFATVDLLSKGRAEIMAGRGSFIESFPLFGYNLKDYDTLFAEKLELLLKLDESEVVSWQGKSRPSFSELGIYPQPYRRMPVWIAVGGTPESIARAGKLGLPLALAIIGGTPDRFVPHVNYYKDAWQKAGHSMEHFQLGINTQGFVADTPEEAASLYAPPYMKMMTQIGKERGWPPTTRQQFEHSRSPEGYLMVGSPQQVIDKILYEHELFGNTRFLLQMSIGAIPHDKMMRSIELFGDVVAPAVRKALASKKEMIAE